MTKKSSRYVERYRRDHLRSILRHAEACSVRAGKKRNAWRHLSVEVSETGEPSFFLINYDAGIAALGPFRERLGSLDLRTITRIAKAAARRARQLDISEGEALEALFLECPEHRDAYNAAVTGKGKFYETEAWAAAMTAALANLATQQTTAADMARIDPLVWRYDRALGGNERVQRELARQRQMSHGEAAKKSVEEREWTPDEIRALAARYVELLKEQKDRGLAYGWARRTLAHEKHMSPDRLGRLIPLRKLQRQARG